MSFWLMSLESNAGLSSECSNRIAPDTLPSTILDAIRDTSKRAFVTLCWWRQSFTLAVADSCGTCASPKRFMMIDDRFWRFSVLCGLSTNNGAKFKNALQSGILSGVAHNL